ncbi:hypothetical protein [Candidatus Enterococcus clewellii]|uniref:Uncharacterized protein n=1 Tax=Candidatus Enterococcus clewellii TaxID=1834193 RepID=A0A242K1D6_9ENTE|nr:hypothetical protein [Enterococcus sp. 9E7_DIV0242]OTP11468.1 hypothetical protein A5888_003567 [Enterococcus sp. 9E7_DIV0242]
MKTKTIAAIVGAVICLGMASQVVESSLDKEAIKNYLTENVKEHDEEESPINFEIGDKDEAGFIERIGF